MNTIHNYVESVFMNLPHTPETAKRKQEMLMNMEAKYQQLLTNGKSENEAIGAALAEFGHIDDSSWATAETPYAEAIPEGGIHLSAAEADDYLDHRHKFAFAMAVGVFLCITAPAAMILFREIPQFFDAAGASQNTIDILALVPLFVFVAAAVALFIIYGARDSEYGLNNQVIHLDAQTRADLSKEQREIKSRSTVAIAAGVVLCILAPVALLLSVLLLGDGNPLSVVFLLSFVAVGVFLFVFYGIQIDSYAILLSGRNNSPEQLRTKKVTDIVASVVFPLAAAVYLIAGFIYNAWATAWVIFPIVGILFGVFAAVYGGYTELKKKR